MGITPFPPYVHVHIENHEIFDRPTFAYTYGLGPCIGSSFYDPETQRGILMHDSIWSVVERCCPPQEPYRHFLYRLEKIGLFNFAGANVVLAGANYSELIKRRGIIKPCDLIEAKEIVYDTLMRLGVKEITDYLDLQKGITRQALTLNTLAGESIVYVDDSTFRKEVLTTWQ